MPSIIKQKEPKNAWSTSKIGDVSAFARVAHSKQKIKKKKSEARRVCGTDIEQSGFYPTIASFPLHKEAFYLSNDKQAKCLLLIAALKHKPVNYSRKPLPGAEGCHIF